MELGEKLRAARLEAGLSQRQLCGEEITRNMLSQIEHGTARPSMRTLQYLASRLGKNVSYFLEEDVLRSPNQQIIAQARMRFDSGDYPEAAELLQDYQEPDPIFDPEKRLLQNLTLLALAQRALDAGRLIYARELLNRLELSGCYCEEDLRRRQLLLSARAGGGPVSSQLPSLDQELLLRAQEAFLENRHLRAEQLLDAVQDQSSPEWNLLRGRILLARSRYREAADCLHRAEDAFPKESWFRLEHCYRELGDYRRAYEYACKQK